MWGIFNIANCLYNQKCCRLTLSRLIDFFLSLRSISIQQTNLYLASFTNPSSLLITESVLSIYNVLHKLSYSIHLHRNRLSESVKIWCTQHVLMLMKNTHVCVYTSTSSSRSTKRVLAILLCPMMYTWLEKRINPNEERICLPIYVYAQLSYKTCL